MTISVIFSLDVQLCQQKPVHIVAVCLGAIEKKKKSQTHKFFRNDSIYSVVPFKSVTFIVRMVWCIKHEAWATPVFLESGTHGPVGQDWKNSDSYTMLKSVQELNLSSCKLSPPENVRESYLPTKEKTFWWIQNKINRANHFIMLH